MISWPLLILTFSMTQNLQLYSNNQSYMMKNPLRLLILLAVLYICSSYLLAQKHLKTYQASKNPYNKAQSRDYAIYAGLAYCPKKCLEVWNCQSGKQFSNFGQVSHISNLVTVASCYIGYEKAKNKIILSFRGSANIQNWIEDFDFAKVSYTGCKGCEMHQGFLDDYLIIQQKIDEKVKKLLQAHPSASILATGHSLGGALSVIAGLRLKQKFNCKIQVHNFGCPRVGNAAMAKYIQTKVDTIYRVVHNRDIVPHLPPQPFEYHHQANEVFWNEDMTNYTICNDSGEDKECSNKFAPDYSAGDHDFYFIKLDTLKC